MIKVLLLVCLAGLAAAQYGHGGGSGYGPDGVRNRYFILGHGRGPISTSIGSGIYGTSLGGNGGYQPSHGGGSNYRAPAPSGHGGYGLGGGHGGSLGGYGLGGGHGGSLGGSRYGSGGSAHSGLGGGSRYGGLGGGSGHGGYAPAAPSYGHSEPVYAPAAPSYGSSHGSGSRGYGGSLGSSGYSSAPAIRSYSAPSAGHGYSAPAPSSYGGHHDDYAQPTPYEFGYDVHNEHGDTQSRQESGDGHGNVRGSYGYRDSYGIFRHVDYVADHGGFRANVRTNEPGTAPQDPADVRMHVEHGGYGGGHGGGHGGY